MDFEKEMEPLAQRWVISNLAPNDKVSFRKVPNYITQFLLTSRVKPRYSSRSPHASPRQRHHFLLFPGIFLLASFKALVVYWRRLKRTSNGLGIACPSNRSGSSAIAFIARCSITAFSVNKETHSGINLGGLIRIDSFALHLVAEHSKRCISIQLFSFLDIIEAISVIGPGCDRSGL